jgi:thiol-disulfide isomerase/thioredoxin
MATIVKTLPACGRALESATRRAGLRRAVVWWAALHAASLVPSAGAASSPSVVPGAGTAVRWPTVKLMDGRTWAPEAGRPQLVVFWSVTCPFCQRHNAHLQRLHERVLAEGGPQILTVSRDRDPAAVQRYLKANGYTFPVTLEHEALRAALAARTVVPLTVLVDRRGRILQSIPGEMFEEDVMELQRLG